MTTKTTSNGRLSRILYSSLLRASQTWEREVIRGRHVLGEKNEIKRLRDKVPAIAASHLHENTVLTGSRLPSLTRWLWRELNRDDREDGPPVTRRRRDSGSDFCDAFSSLRALNDRTAALQQLVYEPYSQCITDGILIEVRSTPTAYQLDQNMTKYSKFEYCCEMTNLHQSKTFKLVSRHWHIVDGEGRAENVRGPGVIGLYPTLAPGQNFFYKSASCWLPTPYATMQGSLQFMDEDTGSVVDATIAPFGLISSHCAGKEQEQQQQQPLAAPLCGEAPQTAKELQLH